MVYTSKEIQFYLAIYFVYCHHMCGEELKYHVVVMSLLKSDLSVMLLSENNSVIEDNNIPCKNRSSIADGLSGSFGENRSKGGEVSHRF